MLFELWSYTTRSDTIPSSVGESQSHCHDPLNDPMTRATQDSSLREYRRRSAEQARIASLFELLPARGHAALDVGARDGYLSLQLAQRFDKVVALGLLPVSMTPC